jgi:alkylation response protein AidB-like acyl-CoA dehydrogenase
VRAPETDAAPDLAAWLREVERFASRTIDAARIERAERIPDDVRAGLGALGAFGVTLDREHGGIGLGVEAACALVRTIARADRSVATMLGLHLGLGTRAIAMYAAPALARAWLPRLASGTAVGAFAATEPAAGSDLTAVTTRMDDDGDDVVLTGEKSYVTNGGIAGCYTVLARTRAAEDAPRAARSHALVLVPAEAPGVERGAEERKLGMAASSTTPVRFEGVRLPRAHVLGDPKRGLDAAHGVLVWGRSILAAGCLGTADAALALTRVHATTRRQFRRPLAAFASVRLDVAEMAARVRAMEALVTANARSVDEGADAEVSSAMTKVFASEGAFDVCDRAIQLHGALGVLEDVGVARLLRDCRVTRIFEGANDVLLVRVGLALVTSRRGAARVGPGAPHAPLLDALAADVDALAREIDARYGARVVGRQSLLRCLARGAIAHAAARAVAEAASATSCVGAPAGSPRPADPALDAFAVALLAREARAALDAAFERDRAEGLADGVARDLFGDDAAPPARVERPRSVTEAHP